MVTKKQALLLAEQYLKEKGKPIDLEGKTTAQLEAIYTSSVVNATTEEQNEFFTWMSNIVRKVSHVALLNGSSDYKQFEVPGYLNETIIYAYNILLNEKESSTEFKVTDFNGQRVTAEKITMKDTYKQKFDTEYSPTLLARGNLNELSSQLSILQNAITASVKYAINSNVQKTLLAGLTGDNPKVKTYELNFKYTKISVNILMKLVKQFLNKIQDYSQDFNFPVDGVNFITINKPADIVGIYNNELLADIEVSYNRTNFNPISIKGLGSTLHKNLPEEFKLILLHKDKFKYGVSIESNGQVDLTATNLKTLQVSHLWMNTGVFFNSPVGIQFRNNDTLKPYELKTIDFVPEPTETDINNGNWVSEITTFSEQELEKEEKEINKMLKGKEVEEG